MFYATFMVVVKNFGGEDEKTIFFNWNNLYCYYPLRPNPYGAAIQPLRGR